MAQNFSTSDQIALLDFSEAYSRYHSFTKSAIKKFDRVLEIGAGNWPTLSAAEVLEKELNYCIVDPETSKSEIDANVFIICNEDFLLSPDQMGKFDVIISKMVLEHLEEPNMFHKRVKERLKENGVFVHFYANGYSLSAVINRLLPEAMGDMILRLLNNRNTDESPKYKAYYRHTHSKPKQILKYFSTNILHISHVNVFVGHSYFRRIPILNSLERMYTKGMVKLGMYSFATVTLIVGGHK